MIRISPPASNQDYGDNVIPAPQVGTGSGSGTVTNIATTAPITGGPITTTGTIGVTDFVASGASHARGTVPDPGAVAGTTKFLREDGTWNIPAGSASSPLTTKGDVWGFSTVDARIPVGANAYVLTADSTQALGVKWAPIPTSGTLQAQEFTASGTFTVPAGVSGVWVTAIGAGGGGSSTIAAATGGGGGGSGELLMNYPVKVTPSGTVTVTIGAKGAGGAAGQASAQAGGTGGNTSFGSVVIARGGAGGLTTGASGAGGGINGSVSKGVGAPGASGTTGTAESVCHFGGGSGGGGGNTTVTGGGAGAGSGGYPAVAGASSASTQAGAGSGASTIYGPGGAGGAGGVIGTAAASTSYGAGGGGGGGKATTTIGGGAGTDGYCLVVWVA